MFTFESSHNELMQKKKKKISANCPTKGDHLTLERNPIDWLFRSVSLQLLDGVNPNLNCCFPGIEQLICSWLKGK